MKTLLALILSASLTAAHGAPQGGTTSTNNSAVMAVIVIGCAAAASAYVVYVHERDNKNVVVPRLCLQRSDDNQTWRTICTKTNVQLNGTNRIEIFREVINNDPHRDMCFYRTMTP